MRLHVELEEVVLDGLLFTTAEQVAFAATLRAELARQISRHLSRRVAARSPGSHGYAVLAAPSLYTRDEMSPAEWGRQVGRSIAGSLKLPLQSDVDQPPPSHAASP